MTSSNIFKYNDKSIRKQKMTGKPPFFKKIKTVYTTHVSKKKSLIDLEAFKEKNNFKKKNGFKNRRKKHKKPPTLTGNLGTLHLVAPSHIGQLAADLRF